MSFSGTDSSNSKQLLYKSENVFPQAYIIRSPVNGPCNFTTLQGHSLLMILAYTSQKHTIYDCSQCSVPNNVCLWHTTFSNAFTHVLTTEKSALFKPLTTDVIDRIRHQFGFQYDVHELEINYHIINPHFDPDGTKTQYLPFMFIMIHPAQGSVQTWLQLQLQR